MTLLRVEPHAQAVRTPLARRVSLEDRSIADLEDNVEESYGELGDSSVRRVSRYLMAGRCHHHSGDHWWRSSAPLSSTIAAVFAW